MAISGRFCVAMDEVFPHGAYVVSEVEPVRDFDKSTRVLTASLREDGLVTAG
ncbi:MAG: hypothetical protein M3Z25_14145 [Actinomycetota bacterium]|nr:hypothetical protein [Actinomycetota bacterium]